MRGSIRRRGSPGTWEYRLELGMQPAQRCRECGKLYWLEGRTRDKCACGGELDNVERRRERTKGGFAKEDDAEQALARAMVKVYDGDHVEPTKTTVAAYLVNEWLPSVKASVRPSTFTSYKMHVECYIVPRIGTIRLRHLNAAAIDKCYRDLAEDGKARRPKAKEDKPKEGEQAAPVAEPAPVAEEKHGLSPMSVRHTHAVLHKALAAAVKRQYIVRNPCDAVDAPRVKGKDKHEMKTWTADEVKTFLTATRDDRLNPMWRLFVSNGLRRGEACGLRWEDVDLQEGRLSVRRALVSAGYVVEVSEPKTKRGTRVMGLAPDTITALREQAGRQADDAQKWGRAWTDSGYIFTREDGQPWHPDRVSKLFEEAVQNATVPRIRLHDLRHTCATLALQAGVHVKVVSEMLGHANISITLDTYSHVNPAMQAEAADRIASLFASAPAGASDPEPDAS